MKKNRTSAIITVLVLTTICAFSSSAQEQTSTVYFLVAIPSMYQLGIGDSYILPLSDPSNINFARELIATGSFKIVSAIITVGADGINRDMLASGAPEWSWHVAEFLGFGDATVEVCDGNPTYTEVEAQTSSEGEQWQICYWTYTVVAEIPPSVPSHSSTWGKIKSLF